MHLWERGHYYYCWPTVVYHYVIGAMSLARVQCHPLKGERDKRQVSSYDQQYHSYLTLLCLTKKWEGLVTD